MPIREGTYLAVFTVILGLHSGAYADIIPRFTVDEMCDNADVITEGTYLGKNRVQIDNVLKASPLVDKDSKTIEVEQLQEHNRTLFNGKTISTKRLVLFLVHRKDTNTWRSVATTDQEGKCGSSGLYWFDDATCYGYCQTMNPGPLQLIASRAGWERQVPRTIADLRADIKTGLANSREWRRSLAISDPSKKAQALARYLLKSTSPKGDKGTYLYKVRKPMGTLGADAVPVLIQVLRTAPVGEKLNPAVLILYDIGPPASQAIPDLVALLSEPDRVFTGYILSALGSTADPRAVPHLRRYLKSEDERLAKDAREALAMHRKRRSEMAKENERKSVEQENAPDKK